MPIPTTGTINSTDGIVGYAESALSTKYADAGNWATYAAAIVEGKLSDINDASKSFDISAFLDAAESAITSIPNVDTPGAITYDAPTAPSYTTVPEYVAPGVPTYDVVEYTPPTAVTYETVVYNAPTAPTYETVTYNAPAAPTYETITYNAPQSDPFLTAPLPTQYSAGTAPSTTVTYDNPDFSDAILDSLKSKLLTDLSTSSTGLGSAEGGLFANAVARENDVLAEAYNQITTAFSSRGFDMPPGALSALQAQESNKSTIRLTDVNNNIMVESAKLAQAWNQTTVTASSQIIDVLARVFDSKIMRNFEAAKTSVALALEGFKAAIQVLVANAELEGKYLGSVGSYNDVVSKKYSSEIMGETSRIGALSDTNKAKSSQFTAEIQGATAEVSALSDYNKALSQGYASAIQGASAEVSAKSDYNKALSQGYSSEIQGAAAEVSAFADSNKAKASSYTAEVQGALGPITAVSESNRSIASGYSAAIQGAAADVQAQAETEKAKATVGDLNSRKALALAEIAKSAAMANIDAATRTFLGEIQILGSASNAAMTMTAAALNGVSVSASVGTTATYESQTSISNSLTETHKLADGGTQVVVKLT